MSGPLGGDFFLTHTVGLYENYQTNQHEHL